MKEEIISFIKEFKPNTVELVNKFGWDIASTLNELKKDGIIEQVGIMRHYYRIVKNRKDATD